jgi:transposase-like protein
MPPLVNLSSLIDDAKCYELVRQHRWLDGVRCPRCGDAKVARDGRDDAQPHRQRYRCTACGARFDDLTGTALAGHHRLPSYSTVRRRSTCAGCRACGAAFLS